MSNTMIDFTDFGEVKKKLYISCPMKGRTEEAIRHGMDRMHKLAEIVFDQELEVISTYVKHDPPETANKAIWCLGESIKKMSEADYFIGIPFTENFYGCDIEARVARDYGIPSTYVDLEAMMPDVVEMDRKRYLDSISAECFTGKECAPMPVCD